MMKYEDEIMIFEAILNCEHSGINFSIWFPRLPTWVFELLGYKWHNRTGFVAMELETIIFYNLNVDV